MSEAILETQQLSKAFGALEVARAIDFKLEPGARHALIGPNGAGKTTLVNLLSGKLRPSEGRVLLGGQDITHMSEARRVKHGIARTFQINTLYAGLSVLDNVAMAVSERFGAAWSMFRPLGLRRDIVEEAMRFITMLRLDDDAAKLVRELPYGRQRLVEIAIALALEPKVLLLDEPAAGVPSAESHIILDTIDHLPGDIAVLIIEHDMDVVFRFAREITVLAQGAVLANGPPEAVAEDPEVRSVYLGEAVHD